VGSPLVRAATRDAFALYARFWYDAFRIRALSPPELVRRTRLEGVEHIRDALADGKGCIAAIPHMGNWDVAGAVIAASDIPIAAVAEVLEPPRLSELFVRHREALGMRVVPLADGTHVGQKLAGLLSENWLVALVSDRDLSGRGIEVEMFGATRRLPAGPGLLSVTSGAPLLVCSSHDGRRVDRPDRPPARDASDGQHAHRRRDIDSPDGRRVRAHDLREPARLASVPAGMALVSAA
jgi:KDO2-lipid IV(A) lauroyltransferase